MTKTFPLHQSRLWQNSKDLPICPMNSATTLHLKGGTVMLRLLLVQACILITLLGAETLLVAEKAYADCCMCGHYVRGCTPPGSYWNGQLCAGCARPDSEIFRVSGPYYNGPSGMRAARELPPSSIRQLDPTDGVLTLMRGGQCMRRSVELRLLTHAGEGLSLYGQNGLEQAVQFQIVAQAD